MDQQVRGVRFVGVHPLAGSHKTGVKAARANLFSGATCVLVPQDRSAVGVVREMWKTTGAHILEMSAAAHDAAVALTSHLPHLLAHALVQSAMKRPDQKILKALMAGSFRDMTRVASSDPEQWVQIFQSNLKNVREALRLFQRELHRLNGDLAKTSLRTTLKKSQTYRLPLFNDI
jgi:prephenate dehydrogenase